MNASARIYSSFDPDDLAGAMRDAPRDVIEAAAKIIYEGVLVASSGPYSTEELLAMYNPRGPYSVADPHPPAHPGIINLQTGLFYRSWVQVVTMTGNAKVETYNTAPYANELAEGTDLAIMRPLPELVAKKLSPGMRALVNRQLSLVSQ